MSLKNQLLALHEAGYKSDEIVGALKTTHLKLRSALHGADIPLPPLSYGARMEIHEAYTEKQIAQASRDYHTSKAMARQCITREPEPAATLAPSNDVLRHMNSFMSPAEIAAHLDTSERRVKHWLANLPGYSMRLNSSDIADINRRLESGESQASIARSYGVSPARICQLNNNKKTQAHNKDIPWLAVSKDLDSGLSVAHVSKKYKISKAAIYGYKKRNA